MATDKVSSLKILLLSLVSKNYGKLVALLFTSVAISLFRETIQAAFGLEMTIKTQFVILWLMVIYLFKIRGYVSISLAVTFIFICSAFFSFGAVVIADEISNLAYLLLAIGLLQQLSDLNSRDGDE